MGFTLAGVGLLLFVREPIPPDPDKLTGSPNPLWRKNKEVVLQNL